MDKVCKLATLLALSALLTLGCDRARDAAESAHAATRSMLSVDEPKAVTAVVAEAPRPPSAEDKRREKLALEWRVIAIASAFTSKGRAREDALSKQFPWKVGIFEDNGDNTYDRVIIDHDRDGKVDETWRWVDGRWTRRDGRVAWGGKDWVPAASMKPGDSQAPVKKDAATIYLRMAATMRDQAATDYEVRDYLAGDGPRFDLKDTDWDARWDLAEVDRDRDGKVDETWTCRDGLVTRRVKARRQVFEFRNGDWVEKGGAKAPAEAP